ncbi:MAG: short-chain dehydrogenase [Pseudomonadales bacterium]|nr:short-chain dehydrogenase [Pseudomonadales bacterium]
MATARTALIVGNGSAIGQAVGRSLLSGRLDNTTWEVTGVCRTRSLRQAQQGLGASTQLSLSDYDEASIQRLCQRFLRHEQVFHRIVICNGLLHRGQQLQPEKRIENFDAHAWSTLMNSNALVPALWLKHLLPVLRKQSYGCNLVLISARVGSIGDNQLGGWYSYRASKAALNMLVATAAVEYQRRAPHTRITLFHPGTTDSPLSKPFQQRVPEGKLFSPDYVAECMHNVLQMPDAETPLRFVDWSGQAVPW